MSDEGKDDIIPEPEAKEAIVDEPPKEENKDEGAKEAIVDEPPKEENKDEGAKEAIVDEPPKEENKDEGAKEVILDEPPKEENHGEEAREENKDEGAKEENQDDGGEEVIVGQPPKEENHDEVGKGIIVDEPPKEENHDEVVKGIIVDEPPKEENQDEGTKKETEDEPPSEGDMNRDEFSNLAQPNLSPAGMPSHGHSDEEEELSDAGHVSQDGVDRTVSPTSDVSSHEGSHDGSHDGAMSWQDTSVHDVPDPSGTVVTREVPVGLEGEQTEKGAGLIEEEEEVAEVTPRSPQADDGKEQKPSDDTKLAKRLNLKAAPTLWVLGCVGVLALAFVLLRKRKKKS